MSEPWLHVIGIGEDGLPGLSDASRAILFRAEIVFGGPRHLELAAAGDRGRAWPVPFEVAPVLAERGRRVVVLASGDPFWFGAGGSLAPHLFPGEWCSLPSPSTFSLAASALGWSLERVACHGLHAVPFTRMRMDLMEGARLICLLRDGAAPSALAEWLVKVGFGGSEMHVMEALGGPRQRIRLVSAEGFDLRDVGAPVAVAIEARGVGLPRVSGLPDAAFASDGQMTKRPIRAMTLSTLAPRAGERLWDIGAGSGSIAIEWCLAGGLATAIEANPARAAHIDENARAFGVDHRMSVVEGLAPAVLEDLPRPDAIFVGGGGDAALFAFLTERCSSGTRLVANAVTLETEALLIALREKQGGALMRIEIATDAPLGRMRGWSRARPVLQWSVTL